MSNHATHWERIAGDGLIYDGPCIVKLIHFWAGGADEETLVYDGRDPISGRLFLKVLVKSEESRADPQGNGVLFGRGIYVDAQNDNDETTVCFIPLD